MDRRAHIVVAVAFVAVILAPGLIQTVSEVRDGERPRALEVFLRPPTARDLHAYERDLEEAFRVLEDAGFRTEIEDPCWIGKGWRGEWFVDLIFSSGNGVAVVDDLWFEHSVKTNVLGLIVRISPVEEMLWSKAFIQERERFDGADVLHLLRARGPQLDWPRLVRRFGPHWRVLLGHLVLFGYVYPGERERLQDDCPVRPPRHRSAGRQRPAE